MKRVIFALCSTTLLLFILHDTTTGTTFVSTGSTWKYLDDGTDQGAAWRQPDFNDSSWASGSAQLGYGDGDEQTVVSYGPNSNDKYITTYFRKFFTVSDASLFNSLLVRILRDDGAVVYLNGSEIFRTNMPDGSIDYLTPASTAVSGDDEDSYFEATVAADELVDSTNVLAIEVHQQRVDSSDISLDCELIGSTETIPVIRKGPYLIYPGDNTQMSVLWQLSETRTCTLQWGLDTSYSEGSYSSSEYGVDHQHKYTITNLTTDMIYYYRLVIDTEEYTGNFRTAPESAATDARFLVYGDTRTGVSDHDSVCASMVSLFTGDTDWQTLLLHVGDWVNEGGTESDWDDEYFNRNYSNMMQLQRSMPIQGCIGNHELNSGPELYSKYWPYPFVSNRYWSFDYGPAHIAVIDQYSDYSSGSVQLTWLEDDLSSSTKQWKFLVFHEPGYSAGGHSNNTDVQTRIQPLCEDYGVDIVFAGHNHYYARAEVNNVVHITTGGGGAPLYAPDSGYPYIVKAVETFEFCRIDISGSELHCEVVKADGSIIDSFELTLCDGEIMAADLTGPQGVPDCQIDLFDFAKFAKDWLLCNKPISQDCFK